MTGKRHTPVPTPHKGTGTWGVKDQRTGQVRQEGATKAEAKQLAKGWNKNDR
jgi:hypothetical protein